MRFRQLILLKKISLLAGCFFLFTFSVHAQQPFYADSLFQKAIFLSQSKDYNQSRELCKIILVTYPGYIDATILISQTFAWQNLFDSARTYIAPVLSTKPIRSDAYETAANIELWDGNYQKSIDYCNAALQDYPNSELFLFKKAKALSQLQEYQQAIAILEKLIVDHPDFSEAITLLQSIKDLSLKNKLKIEYQNTSFNPSFIPFHFGMIEYEYKAKNGTYLARVNYANRNNLNRYQAEIDAYSKLSKKTSAYINLGFSQGDLFPYSRFGIELYQGLPKQFEISAGIRMLYFSKKPYIIYTGSFGKYFGKYWASFRPFILDKSIGLEVTGILQLRRYFAFSDEFVTLSLIKGSIPYVQYFAQDLNRLDSYKIGIDGQRRLKNNFLVGGGFTYEYEEYYSNLFRNRFVFTVNIAKKF